MNLKLVLKLFFNYKIAQTLKTKPQSQITWIQILRLSLQFTPLRIWVFFSCHLPFCLHTLPNAVQATSEQHISYGFMCNLRLGFLKICDTLTLAITPNVMVPTVIQKIGMKLITIQAVSLLPATCESAF